MNHGIVSSDITPAYHDNVGNLHFLKKNTCSYRGGLLMHTEPEASPKKITAEYQGLFHSCFESYLLTDECAYPLSYNVSGKPVRTWLCMKLI